jgi:hypothetical protein
MKFEYVFFGFFALIVGNFAWRFFRSGSLTGAILGGRVTREVGEIPLASGALSSTVLKVQAMESSEGEPVVALVVVSKAPLGASMMPIKLTKTRTRELMSLLQQALGES